MVTDLGTFCCAGCESVFSFLHAAGLGAFYACEVPPGVSQRETAPGASTAYAAFDDEAVRSRFVEFEDGRTARAVFTVPTLHCASCVWLVERLWRLDPAIVRADVDLMRRTVRVTFRSPEISLRRVAGHLAAIGYAPLVDDEQKPGGIPPARRVLFLKLGVAGFAFGNTMLFSIPQYAHGARIEGGLGRVFDGLNVVLALPVLLFSASDYFRGAWHALRERAPSLDVPIAIGLVALFGRSLYDVGTMRGEGFFDSFTGLVFFLLIGRLFQQKAFDAIAFDRSFRSFLPLSVQVVGEGGAAEAVPLERIRPGDRLVLRPGEVVPADAVLEDADAAVDYAFLTGEERPVPVVRGDRVRAGGRVFGRAARLTVEREVAHSRLAALWSNPAFVRRKEYWLTDLSGRVGGWFTVVAVLVALAGFSAWWPDVGRGIDVATAVLIVACPCALALSAPITLGTAMGVLGRQGLYLKHPAVVLDMSRIDTIAFDKTGTLTTAARPDVATEGLDAEAWRMARRLAAESLHPASRAIAAAGPALGRVDAVRETPGKGLRGRVDGHDVVMGSAAYVAMATGADAGPDEGRVVVAIDREIRGGVLVRASARSGVERAAAQLGTRHDVLLLSGDHDHESGRWRPVFGPRMAFRQSPEDKLARVRAEQDRGRRVLMVGDGLNDAGALGAADVGVAVSDETACVVPACDAVVRGDRLALLPAWLAYARRARRVIVAAVGLSLVYNVVGATFALSGALTPLATAILMPLSSLTVIALGVGAMRWRAPETPS